jgi:DNA-binding NarL/FixJ family response regulator
VSYKVILADNHPVFRAGAARIMSVEEDIRIVGQCDDLPRLVKAIEGAPGAVVIFASSLQPDISILTQACKLVGSALMAIIENDEQPLHFTREGVLGVVHRDVSHMDLLRCIRLVANRQAFTHKRSPGVAGSLDSDTVSSKVQERLSPKELKILGLILKGYKNKDIALELHNSEQVIKNYLRSIFDKTGVSDRLELALFTVHHKLLANAALQANALATPPSVRHATAARISA